MELAPAPLGLDVLLTNHIGVVYPPHTVKKIAGLVVFTVCCVVGAAAFLYGFYIVLTGHW